MGCGSFIRDTYENGMQHLALPELTPGASGSLPPSSLTLWSPGPCGSPLSILTYDRVRRLERRDKVSHGLDYPEGTAEGKELRIPSSLKAERDCPDPASGVATVTGEWAGKTLDTCISLGPAAMGTETPGHPARGQMRGWGGADTHGFPWGACLFERKNLVSEKVLHPPAGSGRGPVVGTEFDMLPLT